MRDKLAALLVLSVSLSMFFALGADVMLFTLKRSFHNSCKTHKYVLD